MNRIHEAYYQALLADLHGEGSEYNDEILALLGAEIPFDEFVELVARAEATKLRHGGFPLRDQNHTTSTDPSAARVRSGYRISVGQLLPIVAALIFGTIGIVRCTAESRERLAATPVIGAPGPESAALDVATAAIDDRAGIDRPPLPESR